jgi:hypothetical protein
MSQHANTEQRRQRPKVLRPTLTPSDALRALAEEVGVRHRHFSVHVSREEGCGGLFAFLTTAAPRYTCMVEHLRADHHHLVLALAALRMKLLRADPAEYEALAAESDAIAAAITDHDELEREMLRDALESP